VTFNHLFGFSLPAVRIVERLAEKDQMDAAQSISPYSLFLYPSDLVIACWLF